MNLQLTLANAAVDQADRRWRQHRDHCAQCSTAQRRRQRPEMCGHGGQLYDEMKGCQAELAEERRLAKLPILGQGELFSQAEAGRA